MQKSSRHKVLFLASWYPNRVLPKNGNFIQRHAQAVAGVCEVVSLHVISDAQANDFEVNVEEVSGVCEVTVYYPKSSQWRPDKKYNMHLEAHRQGYAWIVENWGKIDITHLNVIYPAGLFALELKKKYGIPYLITEHWTAFLSITPYRFNVVEKHFIKKIAQAAAILCPVSEDLKSALKSFSLPGPYRVIPNVVDIDTFAFHKERPHTPIKILHVSTFKDAHKNISGILRVLAKLQQTRSDFEVTMVGNKFDDQYAQTIKALGISADKLTILPEVPITEIAALMRTHHLFLLFSNYENLPCVIAEAHCAGMVVLGTDVGGTSEMINKNNGLVVAARNEDALFKNLNALMNNLQNYSPFKIRAEAVKRYSYDNVADTFLSVYNEVLENGR